MLLCLTTRLSGLALPLIVVLALAPAAHAWSWPVQGPVLAPFSYDEAHPYASGQHRGIDIGAKVEVHRIISQLAASGLGIILISSDLPEVLAMSDRILVLHEGRITAEIPRDRATEERVMFAATGNVVADEDATGSATDAASDG